MKITRLPHSEGEFVVSRGYAWYVFTLLFILYVFFFIDRVIINPLFPFLQAEWGISDTQCGWFASIVTLMMTFFVFPISILVDRWSRKKMIAIMGICWGLTSAACALTRNFFQMLTLRSFIGIGESAFTAGGHAMIAAYFPEERRSTINGLFNAAVPLGTAFGMILGGIIAECFGWRYAIGIMALPGIVVALLFFWIKDYKTAEIKKSRVSADTPNGGNMTFVEIVREFLNTPSLLFTYVGYIGNMFSTAALMTWLPTYYHRMEGLPMDKAGIKSSIPFLLAVIGAPIGGLIIDAIRRRWLNARMTVPAVTSLLSAIFIFIGFSLFEGQSQYLMLLVWGVVTAMFAAGGSAVTQDVVHPGLRATSYALALFLMMLFSFTLAPLFVGGISDRYDLLTAFRFLPLFSLLAAAAFFVGSFYYVRDLKKVGKVSLKVEQ
jgi:MFS family permease